MKEKLSHICTSFRAQLPDRRRLFYLPRLFSRQEKIIFLALLIAVTGSGSFSLTRFVARHTKQVPEFGGIYREGLLKQPRLINPLFLASNDTDRDLAKLLYASLIEFDAGGNPIPDLADRYEITDENKTYTFFLRENAQWHDGKPVTADDVLFTIKAIQNPAYGSPLRPNWQGVTAEKINNTTVRFTLRQPYAPFINNLTLGILPAHLWENIDPQSAALSELNLRPVGSGPFAFSEITKTNELITSYTLAAHRQYHREGPYLKKIEFLFFASEEERIQALRLGMIDGAGGIAGAAFNGKTPPNKTRYNLAIPSVFSVFLNTNKNQILADKEIRRALEHALDKKTIMLYATDGEGVVTETPIPKGVFDLSPTISAIPYDPEKAKAILEQAGFKEENGLRVKKIKNRGKETATPLKIVLTTSDAPALARAAERIKTMWQAVGITVDLAVIPIIELESSVIRPRLYETLLFGEVYSHDPDPFSFWHSSQIKDPGLNIALYSNRKADELLSDARKTADREARKKQYEAFEKIITDDHAAIFLYSPSYNYFVNTNIQGIRGGTIVLPTDRFNGVERWFRYTDRAWKK